MCRSFWGKLFRNINNPYILCSNDPKSDEIRPVIRFMSPSCEVYQHSELVVAAEGELGVSCNQNMLFLEARTRLLPPQKISLNEKKGELIKVFFLQFTIFVSTMTQKRLCLKNKISLTVVFRS